MTMLFRNHHDQIIAVILIVSTFATACSTLPIGATAEPSMIIVRNHSNMDIDTVTLRETTRSTDQPARFGSLSPLPHGVSQVYVRPTNPPRFPKNVTLEWIDKEGRAHAQDLAIAKVLRSATGAADEAMVFEIWPNEEVIVFVEQAGHPGPRR